MAGPEESVIIRQGREEDFSSILPLTDIEGWGLNMNMLKASVLQDKQGFIVAEHPQHGCIGCVLVTKTAPGVASGACFIVHPDHRGAGVGWKMYKEIKSRDKHYAVSLFSTPQMEPFYRRHGFTFLKYTTYIYTGQLRFNNKDEQEIHEIQQDAKYVNYSPNIFDKLLEYDTIIHIYPRPKFLKQWLNPEVCKTVVAQNKDGVVVGYGCLQENAYGVYLGPLYTESVDIATNLCLNLVKEVPNTSNVMAWVVDDKPGFTNLLQMFGLQKSTNHAPRLDTQENMANHPMQNVFIISCGTNVLV